MRRIRAWISEKVHDLGINKSRYEPRWIDRHSGGLYVYPVAISFANAMHWAVDVRTPWGFLCAHPTTSTFGKVWPWYAYFSPDATPQSALWGFGPGFDTKTRQGRKPGL